MLHIEQDQGLMIDILHEQDSFLSALKLLSRPRGAGNSIILDTLADNLRRVDVKKVGELVRGLKLSVEG